MTTEVNLNPDGLRRFQRASRDRACATLFDADGPHRFLVADEVGLGKTRVARAIIRSLRDRHSRASSTIVVYLAANAEITRQNLRVLRLSDEPSPLPARPTLLPLHLASVRKPGLHVLGFTPQTSLSVARGTGLVQERALLLQMLRPLWKPGLGWETLELFRANAKYETFERQVDGIKPSQIDPRIATAFTRAVAQQPELKAKFLELRQVLADGNELDGDERRQRNGLIAALREHLAAACLHGLKAQLVVMDEFHRFPDVLEQALEQRTLAHLLLAKTPTLLLSATPYRMNASRDELEAQESLRVLLRFLFDDGPEVKRTEAALREFGNALRTVRADTPEAEKRSLQRLQRAKHAVETLLTRVMSRYERPQTYTPDGDLQLRLESADVAAYLALQRAVDLAATWTRLHSRSTVEFWKSAPYLVNFMRGYRVKQAVTTALADAQHRPKVVQALRRGRLAQLHWPDIQRYKRVAPANPRLRLVEQITLNNEQWRALWVPPSLPPYRPSGPFASAHNEQATKTLIFSGWRVVPGTVAALLGYEAERRAARGDSNTPEARKRRSSRQLLALRYDERNDRPQGTTTLALIYPSSTLAHAVDPYAHTRQAGDLADLASVIADARRTTTKLIQSLKHHVTDNRVDPRWYWAAPMLLDLEQGVDVIDLLDNQPGLRERWRSQTANARTGDAGLEANIELALTVLEGSTPLGRQPRDLGRVLAQLAIGSPATCALRALQRTAAGQQDPRTQALAAAQIGWALRTLMNRPDATSIISPRRRQRRNLEHAYWRDAISYCCQGALQGVLDEYIALLAEELAQPGESPKSQIERIATAASKAIELQSLRVEIDDAAGDHRPLTTRTLSSRFAAAFGAAITEEAATVHPEIVRQTFNSPFWPWVLITTSVGQEGLDFHRYCHSIVHWNVPLSPVELEQREGRIQRYKNHAVRRSLANSHWQAAIKSNDPWTELIHLGHQAAPTDDDGFCPEWTTNSNGNVPIRRYVPVLPFSRDAQRWSNVCRARVYYRLVLGQPNPEDLVQILMENLPETVARKWSDDLRLDLRPR
jgi:superfamily II DNA or RNA helicase